MPRKVCPICENSYIRFVERIRRFSRDVERIYSCENCGTVVWDLDKDTWRKR